jgi:hypothetical protein
MLLVRILSVCELLLLGVVRVVDTLVEGLGVQPRRTWVRDNYRDRKKAHASLASGKLVSCIRCW